MEDLTARNNSGDVDVGSAGGARDVCRVKYIVKRFSSQLTFPSKLIHKGTFAMQPGHLGPWQPRQLGSLPWFGLGVAALF
jgi:hypothetical protein